MLLLVLTAWQNCTSQNSSAPVPEVTIKTNKTHYHIPQTGRCQGDVQPLCQGCRDLQGKQEKGAQAVLPMPMNTWGGVLARTLSLLRSSGSPQAGRG